jgi:hypothetical protein
MPETEPSDRRSTSVGFWVGWLTSAAAAVALVVAGTTVPRSGPYCQAGCLSYPYTDAGAFRFEVTASCSPWLAFDHRSRAARPSRQGEARPAGACSAWVRATPPSRGLVIPSATLPGASSQDVISLTVGLVLCGLALPRTRAGAIGLVQTSEGMGSQSSANRGGPQ